jgi:hypothetical protein
MSKASIVYDTVVSTLETLFPSKSRLYNPYSLTDNPHHLLKEGLGVIVADDSPVPLELKTFAGLRTFSIVFTRELVRTERQVVPMDVLHKNFLEDIFTVRKDFYNADKITLGNNVTQINLGPTSGVESIDGESYRFFSMSIDFEFLIEEDL